MKRYLILFAFLFSCSGADDSALDNPDSPINNIENNTDVDLDPELEVPPFEKVCNYTNPFSMGPECRSYIGDWDEQGASDDCDAQQGSLESAACTAEGLLANCDVEKDDLTTVLFFYGEPSGCGFAKLGCDIYDGTFRPTTLCDDSEPVLDGVFIQPELLCSEPVAGEPAGASPGGEVCVWQAVSGAVEEGRKFQDYASCDVVRTQRPYYAYPRPDDAERDDPRMEDPDYVTELSWVKSQIEATACVCCHSSDLAPNGVSNFDIEQPGNFMNGFFDSGLALGANWVDSQALGAYPPEENNDFERYVSGFMSTDPDRMKAFFVAELDHRGLNESDFDAAPPFGGPLFDQIYYEPAACAAGVGIDRDDIVTWEGGDARYLYVLEEGSLSPTVPPNLDLPEGTIWRLDVASEDEPLKSGEVELGSNSGATQRVPAQGEPTLVFGDRYYLYASRDVGIPVTRCLFIAP